MVQLVIPSSSQPYYTVFMQHSNFGDFWVAPCIFSSWDCVQFA